MPGERRPGTPRPVGVTVVMAVTGSAPGADARTPMATGTSAHASGRMPTLTGISTVAPGSMVSVAWPSDASQRSWLVQTSRVTGCAVVIEVREAGHALETLAVVPPRGHAIGGHRQLEGERGRPRGCRRIRQPHAVGAHAGRHQVPVARRCLVGAPHRAVTLLAERHPQVALCQLEERKVAIDLHRQPTAPLRPGRRYQSGSPLPQPLPSMTPVEGRSRAVSGVSLGSMSPSRANGSPRCRPKV